MFRHQPSKESEPDSDKNPLLWVTQLIGWLLVGVVSLLGMSTCVGLYENPHNHNSPLLGYGITAVVLGAMAFVAGRGPAQWATAWRFLLSSAYRHQTYERWRHLPKPQVVGQLVVTVFSFVVLNLSLGSLLWWLSS